MTNNLLAPVSRRKLFQLAGLAASAGLVPPVLLKAAEPHVVTPSYNTLSEEEEIALGRKFAAQYERKVQIMNNPLIDAYLNDIVRKLGAASQRPNWPYRVKVMNVDEVNASAINRRQC